MTKDEARHALIDWRIQRQQQTQRRPQLVHDALTAGLTKTEIHEISGIARTTIDRIISTRCPDCGAATVTRTADGDDRCDRCGALFPATPTPRPRWPASPLP